MPIAQRAEPRPSPGIAGTAGDASRSRDRAPGVRRIRRRVPALAAALGLALAAGAGIPAARAAAERAILIPPKVVIIVGPVGSLTGRYVRDGRAAAAEARRWTTDVTLIVPPDATWSAVRAAAQGASLFVYLGHGNGFPSPHGSRLNPATMDGLGLDPARGAADDTRHVYVGEGPISRQVRLSPGAVVLLSHLCYASGNGEQGMADPSLSVAMERVDNFAAGFLAAGASAVVAEAYGSPATWVRTLLGSSSNRSIRAAWRSHPAAHGRELVAASERTTGAVVRLDPERAVGGYTRSLVERPAATLGNLRARIGASGTGDPGTSPVWLVIPPVEPLPASLPARGVEFGTPDLSGTPVAGITRQLAIPIAVPAGITLPAGLAVAVRWRPLDAPGAEVASPGAAASSPAPGASPAPPAPTASPATGASPATSAAAPATTPPPAASPPSTATPTVTPAASTGPTTALDPGPWSAEASADVPVTDPREPPDSNPGIVEPAGPALVVAVGAARGPWALVPATIRAGELVARLELPATPGLWSLEISLADGSGRELPEVDALVDDLQIRVGRPFDGILVAPATIRMTTGGTTSLLVRATNTGDGSWVGGELVGRWVPLADGASVPAPARAPLAASPGETTSVGLVLVAPARPGVYLLLLDVETAAGSLAAAGTAPSIVRVAVAERGVSPTAAP